MNVLHAIMKTISQKSLNKVEGSYMDKLMRIKIISYSHRFELIMRIEK